MEDLIPLINKLQAIFKETGMEEMKLPQIVVVGAQESLVKKPFLPRGTGIVTRCPIILQLNQVQVKPQTRPASMGNKGIGRFSWNFVAPVPPQPHPEEWCRFSKNPEKIYTDFNEVREEIEDLQVKIAGDKKGISMEPIILEVFSPNVINLTLVDLPGIVKIALDGQPADIEDQVFNLIRNYIKNDSAIILAVSAANADIATSESIKLAKGVDPEGNRTIAVVTKLDLMDKGTDAANVLSGEVIKVKLGIVGVVNRSQQDINNGTSMEEALRKEEMFLKKTYPQIHGIGSPYLATRLNHLLKEHIHKNLPALIKRIAEMSEQCEMDLQALGREISPEPNECSWLITDPTLKFVAKFREAVHCRPMQVKNCKDLFAGRVTGTFKRLREEIVVDEEEINAAQILVALNNTLNFEGFSSIEQVFKSMVRNEIQKMEEPAVACAKRVHELMVQTVAKCFVDERLTCLNNAIKGVVEDLLAEQLKKAKIGIKEYIELQRGMIFSSDQDFVQSLTEGPDGSYPDLGTDELKERIELELALRVQQEFENRSFQDGKSGKMPLKFRGINRAGPITAFPLSTEYSVGQQHDYRVVYIHKLIVKYLDVVKRELSDYVPKYLMLQLGKKTIEKISEAVKSATIGKETALVAEPENIRIKRKNRQVLLTSLREAAKTVRDIKMQW